MPDTLSEITALAVADHLIKTGQVKAATDVLVDLISHQPGSVKGLAMLARLAYACKSWKAAGEFWNSIIELVPEDIEANLKLTHCLMESRDSGAEAQVAKLAVTAGRAEVHRRTDADDLLRVVYEQACVYLLSKDWQRAAELLKACALPNSYVDKITAISLRSRLNPEAIVSRIERAVSEWRKDSQKLPSFNRKVSDEDLQPIAGKKVLLVLRKFFLANADSRDHEFTSFIRGSAQSVGLETLFFPADPFLNSKLFTAAQQYEAFDRLASEIARFQPDFVLFDGHCMHDLPEEYAGPDVFRGVLSQLKERIPFKLIAFYPDPWTEDAESAIQFSKSFAEVLWLPNRSFPDAAGGVFGRVFHAPIPYPEEAFSLQGEKDIEAAFVGSVREHNYLRGVWMTLMQAKQVPCDVFLTNHTTNGDMAGLTVEEYAHFIAKAKVTVNFSARTPARSVVKGRVWEAILSMSALLEEDNEEIRRWLVPFVHYIPFKTLAELSAYLRFFKNQPEAREAMVERAFSWFATAFGKERIWAMLFSLAVKS